jgi:thiamine biosynthesis lipoprotein
MKRMDDLSCRSGSMNRRSFLKLSGLLGLGVSTAGIMPATATAVKFKRKMVKVSETRLAMGTFVSMTLIHSSRDEAENAMGLAFEEIDRLTGLLSRFDQTAAVAQLNKEGYLKDIPPEMIRVVERALQYHKLSHGTFDITVKPVVDLFVEKLGGEKKIDLTEKEIARVLDLVDAGKVHIEGRSIRFLKPGMGMTLDGIAKGYVVDSVSQLLSQHNIGNHLINAGGDIRTRGTKADERPWRIAIEDPAKKKNYPDIIKMRDGAVATSGNYEIYFDREKMFHHIVDPRSGLSPELNAGVSVIADNTMDADALSTSVFVMTPTDGVSFINALPNSECLVITKEGTLLKSTGWKTAAI